MSNIKERILKLSQYKAYESRHTLAERRLQIIKQLAELIESMHRLGKEENMHWLADNIEVAVEKLEGRGE